MDAVPKLKNATTSLWFKYSSLSENHYNDLPSPAFYHQLDGLRCLCVMGVLFQHYISQNLTHYFQFGLMGVDLFFVISGFLITENLLKLKRKQNVKNALKSFYIRRILRIFPVYYLYWGIILVFYFFTVNTEVLPGLLYYINFYAITNEVSFLTGHLWSLAVEEQFYLIWPLIILMVPDRRLLMIVFLFFLGSNVFIFLNLDKNFQVNALHTISCAVALISGSIIAIMKHFNFELKKIIHAKGVFVIALFLIYICISSLVASGYIQSTLLFLLRYITCIIGIFLIVRITLQPFQGYIGKFLSNRIIAGLGKISYGIYIYHYLVYFSLRPYIDKLYTNVFDKSYFENGLFKYFKYNPTIFQFPIYVCAAVLIAYISYNLFELRFLKMKKSFC